MKLGKGPEQIGRWVYIIGLGLRSRHNWSAWTNITINIMIILKYGVSRMELSLRMITKKKKENNQNRRICFYLQQSNLRRKGMINVLHCKDQKLFLECLRNALPFSQEGCWTTTCMVVTPPGMSHNGLWHSPSVLLFSNIFPALINLTSFTVLGPFSFSKKTRISYLNILGNIR